MIGLKVGPYRVVQLLGEGGMGAVYEAVNDDIERRVAIKVLHADYARQPDVVARFFNEARAVNRIDHPSLVQIHEYGHLPDGTAYIVMEYLKGETLASRLLRSGGQVPPQVAAQIAWQVAAALCAAHNKNIVHRDLKPANLMLVPDPLGPRGERVKVLDFGIAKLAADARQGKTATNMVMGTPTYMSPEQCRGAGTVDEKTDVYSLGVILFEMICGRPPFISEGAGELMGLHLFQQPPSLKDLAPSTPADIAAFTHTLLAKDRTQRPSMGEVAERLIAVTASAGAGVTPSGQGTKTLLVTGPASKPGESSLSPAPSSMMELARGQTSSAGRARKPLITILLGGGAVVAGLIVWFSLTANRSDESQGRKRPLNSAAAPSPSLVSPPTLPAASGTSSRALPVSTAAPLPAPGRGAAENLVLSTLVDSGHPTKSALRKKAGSSTAKRSGAASISEPGAPAVIAKEKTNQADSSAADNHADLDKAVLDNVLKTAQAALDSGNYRKAIDIAKMAQADRPKMSWLIVGAAACKGKDVKLADDAFSNLDADGQRLLINTCLASGVERRSSRFAVPK